MELSEKRLNDAAKAMQELYNKRVELAPIKPDQVDYIKALIDERFGFPRFDICLTEDLTKVRIWKL